MAKKKQNIDLKNLNIRYEQDNSFYEILFFKPSTMTLHLRVTQKGEKKEIKDFPFAHLPKEIKKRIKPN